VADFNGDHIPDIAVSDGVDGYTWIYLGNGDGTFKLADTQKFGGNSLVAGDFNADGKQDVAYASGYESGGDTVGMFLGNGNGTLKVSSLCRFRTDAWNGLSQTSSSATNHLGADQTFERSRRGCVATRWRNCSLS
jgi:FG-GAP-like repeat